MYLCTDHVRQSGSWLIISTSSQLYSTRVCRTNSESSSQLHICVCCNRLSQKITLQSSMSNRCCVAAPVRFISGRRGQTSVFRRVKWVMSVCWCVSEESQCWQLEQKELKKTRWLTSSSGKEAILPLASSGSFSVSESFSSSCARWERLRSSVCIRWDSQWAQGVIQKFFCWEELLNDKWW